MNNPGWAASPALAARAPRALAAAHALQMTAVLLPFLFIGTVFHHHLQGHLSTGKACLLVAVLGAAFAGAARLARTYDGSLAFLGHYFGTVVLFAACYALRDRLGASRALGKLADISYPVYVIHGFAGYCVMRV